MKGEVGAQREDLEENDNEGEAGALTMKERLGLNRWGASCLRWRGCSFSTPKMKGK